MKENCPLSALTADQMTAVLDNAPVAIYVSEVDTYRLLYANHTARSLFLQAPDSLGLTCYQAAGFDAPCAFCKSHGLSRSTLFVREFHHPVKARTYQLSGKIIDWDGKPAHIEYILDITEKKQEERRNLALKEELQITFSSIPCGLCVYQFDQGRIAPVFHNPAFYDILGYSQAHIRAVEQETTFLNVHPEDLPSLQAAVQEAVRTNTVMQQSYRLWNDSENDYRWIQLVGSVKSRPDGTKLLYGVYSDVSEQKRLEKALTTANDKMQDIVNAIPGGVAIYKVTDRFETVYFSDGVPALTGYAVEEYRELARRDAAEMIYREDTAMVVAKAQEVIAAHGMADIEFRKQHRDGHIVWVRVQVKWIGEEDGCPLLHCVFHNISDLKEAQLEMDHLVNSIPGGIASYRVEGGRFLLTYYSDGVPALSGHTREEYDALVRQDARDVIYEQDKERVMAASEAALVSGGVLDVSFRMRHKDGNLIWIHFNGRRMGPLMESTRFYAVFTGMSAETRLFQNIANETADGIYVIDKATYDLLYANESKHLFAQGGACLGQKCYTALHGNDAPCAFCTLQCHAPDGEEHGMVMSGDGRFYATRFRETDWNGIPAYVKYVRDVTEEVKTRQEKERLEQYFQTVVKNLPGGVAVVRCEQDGRMVPEYLSDGFAAMTGMSLEEAWRLYRQDAMAGVHPDDLETVNAQMAAYIASGDSHCEIVYRLKKGPHAYVWVKNTLSLIQNEGGENRVYAVYRDITKDLAEQERVRQQYKDLIVQHYQNPGPNALIIGHCNITRNRILEIIDHTDSALLDTFGSVREPFFTGLAGLIVEEADRQTFLNTYLNAPALAAFQRNDIEQIMECFVRLPKEPQGRYVQIQMNMVATPDSGDVTGILTVTDITERTITDRILHQLSATGYDLVVDVDLTQDRYTILSSNDKGGWAPPRRGCHSTWTASMLETRIVPRDREAYRTALDPVTMSQRLQQSGPYTFAYSMIDAHGDIRTKNMTVSAIDLRLGRICLSRADITASIREQQRLLRVIAYTFELAGFIDIRSNRLTMYTRQTVLENLAPYIVEHYDEVVGTFSSYYGTPESQDEIQAQLHLDTMLQRLTDRPTGYDIVFQYRSDDGPCYKQINVLWGDDSHKTVCLVRADVTDMLAAERQTKKALEQALSLAKEASQAKSAFLSAMSHDIRTPMNAIMGMTALAVAHLDDQERVADCLQKISISSKHLLSLINDVLDMSKIERSKITLNRMKISLPDLIEQISAIMAPQARAAGLRFTIRTAEVQHSCFYGDALRLNQILINILSNAVKFTAEDGQVDFLVEEIPPQHGADQVRYRFTIRDTGMGMSEDYLAHIFDPFTRSRRAAHIEGTGLGLSITKGLIDRMDGTIDVDSRVNEGTTFRVELEWDAVPAEEAAADTAAQTAGAGTEPLFTGRCFLVAEDNAINAEILCELLSMDGARTVVTPDGEQVVSAFRQAPAGTYDAVLMDIQMPQMNGYEATRAIRELPRADAKRIPIIAMTANAFTEDVQASLEAGMTAHVAKPIDIHVLRETLRSILDAADMSV